MDFPSPQPIRDVVHQCAEHGIFGYTDLGDDFLVLCLGKKNASCGYKKRRNSILSLLIFLQEFV